MSVEVLSHKLLPAAAAAAAAAPSTTHSASSSSVGPRTTPMKDHHHHHPAAASYSGRRRNSAGSSSSSSPTVTPRGGQQGSLLPSHSPHHHHHPHHPSHHPHSASRQHFHREQKKQQQQQLDVSQNFDTEHILYDASTDSTYLRGRLLGKGGFARCYELLGLADNKIYAGKIIHKSRISKPHQKQKILDEVKLQKNLMHRNVVQFHSYFEDDTNVYIILENCSRKSLMHMMKQHRQVLTEPEVRYYMQQMAEGVQYVHAQCIIHRDLKLGNLLLDDTMDLKIADFGLAARIDFEGERKMTVCGTPNYIAPEVLQKKGHSYEADIWAMGCTMYAMLVGRPPFETSSLTETYQRITHNSYKIPSHVSMQAASLIRKCLSPKPHNRPSVGDILADEFFACGYFPRTLSPSCCTSVPQFPVCPDHSKSGQHKQSPAVFSNHARTEPVCHLGNALSRMQLNSCSENLLEEKELEAIEKPAAQRSPKPMTQGQSSSGQVTACAGEGEDRKHSPSQKAGCPKPRSAATLLEALSACLQHMPKECASNPEAVNEGSIVWVTKWVDYSNKYGFGFRLSTDTMGVLFNDTSRILLSPDGRSVQYCDMTEKLSAYTLDSVPEEMSRKTTLLQYFARYMDEHLIQGGELESSQNSDLPWASSLYLKKWFRTTKAIVLYLTDGTLQVNFFDDHAKVIFSSVKGNYLVTFIDPERNAKTYPLSHIARGGCQTEISHRMAFAHTLLKNLVDIEGDDV
ncbi:serine/threonine-protein kinase PLK1-like [Babylonia areolata]|uniref:serine/threonine-protein kinase PLK1-like n=1 Tax=Babylonia areolata TaxID=304850 RepID=UPI003FD3FB43